MTQTQINIDEISKPVPVTVKGETHLVLPVNVTMLTVLRGDGDNIEKLLTVLVDRVPSLTRAQLEDLSLAQLNALLDLSTAGVHTVEQAAPNAAAETAPQPSPSTPV